MKRSMTTLLAVGLGLAACGDPAGPELEEKPEDQLVIVRFDTARFQTAQRSGSFWAVRGEERRLELRYADSSGPGGPEFLEFRVRDESLLRRPDGTAFQEGDSILITVNVDPGGRFVFDFQPSGLEFNPLEPAELEVNTELADQDLNGDGVVNEADDRIKQGLSIWKQEASGAPWLQLQSLRIREHEVRADVTGFTGFACAN
jgi:hypothetical protein